MAQLKEPTIPMPDWSLLPNELLHIISRHVEDCFDVVHARSVSRMWRSAFPFPSCLLPTSYSLPVFVHFPGQSSKHLFTLKKIPLFLFRARALPLAAVASPSEFFLGRVGRDESEDHMELPSPLQCSVKMNITGSGSDPTLMNMLDCQIFPLGHQYKMLRPVPRKYKGVAFLPLTNEGGGEFVVLLNYTELVLVLRSAEMRWTRLETISNSSCDTIVTFKGRFYAMFFVGDVFVIDPYSLEVTPPMPSQPRYSFDYLVPSGDDELFLVKVILPRTGIDALNFSRLACRVCRLDEEAGEWVEVSDLGDRVLFIGPHGNVSCSAKELPDGCGVSGDSILITTQMPGNVTYFYKYGVRTAREEDDLSFWRCSGENRVTILSTYLILALRVEL